MVYPKELSYDDFAMAPAAMAEAVKVDRFRQGYSQIPSLHSAHFLKIDLPAFDPSSVSHLDVEVALASCFDLHVADPQEWMMDHVRLAVVDHLLLCHDVAQVTERIGMTVVVPVLLQHLKIFFLLRAIFAVPVNQASARIADVEVASYNVLAPVYDRSDIVCAEDDIVFELAVAVRYEEVYSVVAFASATVLVIVAFVAVAELDRARERSVVEAVASAVVHW